jgi:peptidoglycan-associated lipoprotein
MTVKRLRAPLAGILLVLGLLATGGCKKKTPVVTPTPPPAQPSSPAPTIQLTAEPSIVAVGGSTTLSWTTTDADEVVIENVGRYPANGSTVIRPAMSTTIVATANGRGGKATAQVRVTVTAPPPTSPETERPSVEEGALGTEELFKSQIHDVFFDFDKYDLTPESKDILRQDAEALTGNLARVKFVIEGHCDERGTEEYNLGLGDKRANAARDYLISLGVSADRIETISYGEERPFDPGHNEEAWAKNRRAHFVMVKP